MLHNDNFHLVEEKTFRCSHVGCDKTFKFRTSLEVHIRIHKGE